MTAIKTVDATTRREDLTWMAETGESSIGAAARLGITESALERWCHRHNCGDLYRRLLSRSPHDPHARSAGQNQWTKEAS